MLETSFESVRRDFPILNRKINGKRLVYLDSAATSQKPKSVVEAIASYYRRSNANIHRGLYALSEEATALYEKAREKLARFISARRSKEVVFTRNTTEALNLLAHSVGGSLGRDDHVLLTEMEHHSNIVPWQLLAGRKGVRLAFVPFDRDGKLDLGAYERMVRRLRPKIVSFTHASNVLGTINPVREMTDIAHAAGALVILDGTLSVPHMPVSVRRLGIDFLAFSGHKMLGPTGIGVLWGREELLEQMPPFLGGGGMIKEVKLEGSSWNELPWKFEAGTPNISGAIGLGAAVDYLEGLGMGRVRRHGMMLMRYALEKLGEWKDLDIYGPMDARKRAGVIAFNMRGVHAHDVAAVLDSEGIAIRAGHHCAQPLMERLGVRATARASFYIYNSRQDIDALAEGLEKVRRMFG